MEFCHPNGPTVPENRLGVNHVRQIEHGAVRWFARVFAVADRLDHAVRLYQD